MRNFHLGRLCKFSACYNRMLPWSGWTARRVPPPRRCGLRETSNECGQSNETKMMLAKFYEPKMFRSTVVVVIISERAEKRLLTLLHGDGRDGRTGGGGEITTPRAVALNAKSVITTHLVLSFCSFNPQNLSASDTCLLVCSWTIIDLLFALGSRWNRSCMFITALSNITSKSNDVHQFCHSCTHSRWTKKFHCLSFGLNIICDIFLNWLHETLPHE